MGWLVVGPGNLDCDNNRPAMIPYDDHAYMHSSCLYRGRAHFFTLNMLNSAKHPYSRPTGYATSNRWRSIRRTATNIELAECVHQMIEMTERK